MKKIYLTLLVTLLVSGCQAGAPWQRWMFEGPPPGKEYHPLYVEGWIDGCESGTSATATSIYKFKYKFRQDPIKAQNRVYYKGWKDSFDYCQRYIFQYRKRGIF